jgi:purine-binding chemotaxis protein CheW
MLLCRARRLLCALPVEVVLETMRPLPVTEIGGSPAFVRGLSLIRGVPTPVVDLGALLAAPEAARTGRFLTLRVGSRTVALAVEEVLGFRRLGTLAGLPPLLSEVRREAVAAMGRLDRELLLVLETSRLLGKAVLDLADMGSRP